MFRIFMCVFEYVYYLRVRFIVPWTLVNREEESSLKLYKSIPVKKTTATWHFQTQFHLYPTDHWWLKVYPARDPAERIELSFIATRVPIFVLS